MELSMARFTAFFLLFVSATSAPTSTSPPADCTTVRNSALKFNLLAKDAAKGSKGIKNFSTPIAWMEAQDQCDPGTLRDTPEPCIKKILDVLTSYKSLVKDVAKFGSCPAACKVEPVLMRLHEDISRCVKMDYRPLKVNDSSDQSVDLWKKPLLCEYTMERLFSFSILTARVFSVGHPANHKEPTEPKDCAPKN